uniref:Uncharacterized protein n=1 Tax=Brassica campestris TaxID=3711 RepID=A0A3P5XZ81_BRACM|nr:unnamed protein product [Brassica rapa]
METIICCGLRLKHRFQLRIFETILREFLKSFLLHIQLWLDVLDLQVGVDELEFLVILIHWFPFLLFREFVGFLLWVIIQAIKLAQLLLWHYISWQEPWSSRSCILRLRMLQHALLHFLHTFFTFYPCLQWRKALTMTYVPFAKSLTEQEMQ